MKQIFMLGRPTDAKLSADKVQPVSKRSLTDTFTGTLIGLCVLKRQAG